MNERALFHCSHFFFFYSTLQMNAIGHKINRVKVKNSKKNYSNVYSIELMTSISHFHNFSDKRNVYKIKRMKIKNSEKLLVFCSIK